MSTTAPNATTVTAPAPAVPEQVTAVEQKVEDAAPADLKETATQVADDFNQFEQGEVQKAEEAAPAEKAANEASEPDIEQTAEALSTGNIAGAVTNLSGDVKEVKAGYKTTEFWLTLAGVVLTQIGALRVPGKYGDAIQTTGLLGSYALSRGLAK